MSELDRLVDSLLFPGFVGLAPPEWLLRRAEEGLGGVVLFGRNVQSIAQVRALTDALKSGAPDLLVSIDEEGGDVTRLEASHGSSRPGALALGVVDDPSLTSAVASAIANDLVAAGVDWNLAPIADVNSNPDNPVIGVRSFGSDPEAAARHVAAYVEGLQALGVAACAKHFPGHGDTAVDSHLGLPVVDDTADQLAAGALVPFKAAIAAGVRTVMTGHLVVPAYDPDIPATLSHRIVTGLLREELGFDGVVMSDALEMAGVAEVVGIEEGAIRAVLAGCDALCIGGSLADEDVVFWVHAALVAAVTEGRLPEKRLVEAADRLAALAGWTKQDRPIVDFDDTASVHVARAALSTTGDVSLSGPPLVVELDPEPTIAVGYVPWGIGKALAQRLPGTAVVRVSAEITDVDDLLKPGRKQPLVVVVRDAHRHPWQARTLAALLGPRPDAIVVDMGLPDPNPRPGARLVTHGAARVQAEAACDLLIGGYR